MQKEEVIVLSLHKARESDKGKSLPTPFWSWLKGKPEGTVALVPVKVNMAAAGGDDLPV